jgi:hypothetical protein
VAAAAVSCAAWWSFLNLVKWHTLIFWVLHYMNSVLQWYSYDSHAVQLLWEWKKIELTHFCVIQHLSLLKPCRLCMNLFWCNK